MKTTKVNKNQNKRLSLLIPIILTGVVGVSNAATVCQPGYTKYTISGQEQCVENPASGQQVFVNNGSYSNGYYSTDLTCPSGYTEVYGTCYQWSCPYGTSMTNNPADPTAKNCTTYQDPQYCQNISCNAGFQVDGSVYDSYCGTNAFNPLNGQTVNNFKCFRLDYTYNTIPTITAPFATNIFEMDAFSFSVRASNADYVADGNGNMSVSINKSTGNTIWNSSSNSTPASSTVTISGTGMYVKKIEGTKAEKFNVTFTDPRGASVSEIYDLNTTFKTIFPTITTNDEFTGYDSTNISLNTSVMDIDQPNNLIIQWNQVSGTIATITDANKATPTIKLPLRRMYEGTEVLEFNVSATDEDGNKTEKLVKVNNVPQNSKPVPITSDKSRTPISSPMTVNEGVGNLKTTFCPYLSHDVEDSYNDLTFKFELTSQTVVPITYVADPSDPSCIIITHPEVKPAQGTQSYTFSLTATDLDKESATQDIVFKVVPTNINPTLSISKDGVDVEEFSATDEETVTLRLKADDVDGFINNITWEQVSGTAIVNPVLTTINSKEKELTFKMPNRKVSQGNEVITIKAKATDDDANFVFDTVNITLKPSNIKPVVDYKALSGGVENYTVNELTEVKLDGSATYDPDGKPNTKDGITYQWIQVSGKPVTIINNTSVNNASFIAHKQLLQDGNGKVEIKLIATDDDGESSEITKEITIVPINTQPVALTNPDFRIAEQTVGTLDAANSYDPDGSNAYGVPDPKANLKYFWKQTKGETVSITNFDKEKASFVTPIRNMKDQKANGDGVLEFELTVTDEDNQSSTKKIVVNYFAVNELPVAVPGSDRTVKEKTLIGINGDGSYDNDGFIESYKWEVIESSPESDITINNPTSKETDFVSPEQWINKPTKYNIIRLTVTDNDGETGYADFKVSYVGENLAPIIDYQEEFTFNEKTEFTLTPNVFDNDGFVESFEWKRENGLVMNNIKNADKKDVTMTTPVRKFSDGIGSSIYSLTVTDNEGTQTTKNIKINTVPINEPPVPIVQGLDENNEIEVEDSTDFILNGLSSYDPDEDGSIIAYEWKQLEGEQVIKITDPINGETHASTPYRSVLDGKTKIKMQLKVLDNDGAFATKEFFVVIAPKDIPPTANAGDDFDANELSIIKLDGAKSFDPDGTIAKYEWKVISGDATIASEGSDLKGTPTANSQIINLFTPSVMENEPNKEIVLSLKVTDNENATNEDTVKVTVKPINSSPTVQISKNEYVKGSNKVYLTPTYNDLDGTVDKVEFEVKSGNPLNIESKDGVGIFISPNPPDGTELQSIITVTVTDNEGSKNSADITYKFYHGEDKVYTMEDQKTFAIVKNLLDETNRPISRIESKPITDSEDRVINGILPIEIYSDKDVIVNGYNIKANEKYEVDYDFNDKKGVLSLPIWAKNLNDIGTYNVKAVVPFVSSRILVKNYNGVRYWSDKTFASSCNDYRNRAVNDNYQYWGDVGSGIYRIENANKQIFDVYCDMFTNGGGWTLINDTNVNSSNLNIDVDDKGINYSEVMIDGSKVNSDYNKSETSWDLNGGVFFGSRAYLGGNSVGLLTDNLINNGTSYLYQNNSILSIPAGYSNASLPNLAITNVLHNSRNDTCKSGDSLIPFLCYDRIAFKTNDRITKFTDIESDSGFNAADNWFSGQYKIYVK
jgi:hypothetical protein